MHSNILLAAVGFASVAVSAALPQYSSSDDVEMASLTGFYTSSAGAAISTLQSWNGTAMPTRRFKARDHGHFLNENGTFIGSHTHHPHSSDPTPMVTTLASPGKRSPDDSWQIIVTWPVGCESWAVPCPSGAHTGFVPNYSGAWTATQAWPADCHGWKNPCPSDAILSPAGAATAAPAANNAAADQAAAADDGTGATPTSIQQASAIPSNPTRRSIEDDTYKPHFSPGHEGPDPVSHGHESYKREAEAGSGHRGNPFGKDHQ